MFKVTASVLNIHNSLNTELGLFSHSKKRTEKKSVRAVKPLSIPQELHSSIAFVSLNAPVNHVMPRGAKALAQARKESRRSAGVEETLEHQFAQAVADVAAGLVAITPGNEEALATFQPFCGLGATNPNQENPPCQSAAAADTPSIQIAVTEHANVLNNTYQINQEPTIYNVPLSSVYCYNNHTALACSGTEGSSCMCIAKVK